MRLLGRTQGCSRHWRHGVGSSRYSGHAAKSQCRGGSSLWQTIGGQRQCKNHRNLLHANTRLVTAAVRTPPRMRGQQIRLIGGQAQACYPSPRRTERDSGIQAWPSWHAARSFSPTVARSSRNACRLRLTTPPGRRSGVDREIAGVLTKMLCFS